MADAPDETEWAFLRAVDLYRRGAYMEDIGPVLQQAQVELEMLTIRTVERAAERESWQAIGAGLGVSRQAARKRYGA